MIFSGCQMRRRVFFRALMLSLTVGVRSEVYSWSTNEGSITITGFTGTEKNITIPEAITGLPVRRIGNYAFNGQRLVSITIPDSVTNIGSAAFYGCYSLVTVSLGAGLQEIEEGAFA